MYCDGSCVVTAPLFARDESITAFVSSKGAWIRRKLSAFMPFRPSIKRASSRVHYLKHKESARELVARRLPELNAIYGFKIGKIAIRNQKSRWGSCSAKGNLNFNYKIALLPARLSDYVMVHELCHLGELNHSEEFWTLVAKSMPEYRTLRRELREHKICI